MADDMDFSLTPQQEQFVRELVASGRYASAAEAVQAALELLDREEQNLLLEKWLRDELTPEEDARLRPDVRRRAEEHVRKMVERAQEDVEAGRIVDGDELLAEMRERIGEYSRKAS